MGSLTRQNIINNKELDFFDNFFGRSFFEDLWSSPIWANSSPIQTLNHVRESQVTETDDDYQIALAAPGVEKKNFSVTIESNKILIGYDASDTDCSFTRASKYSKSYEIPADCDVKKISASHDNGVLKVTIAKAEKLKPLQVKIN